MSDLFTPEERREIAHFIGVDEIHVEAVEWLLLKKLDVQLFDGNESESGSSFITESATKADHNDGSADA